MSSLNDLLKERDETIKEKEVCHVYINVVQYIYVILNIQVLIEAQYMFNYLLFHLIRRK